jgi:outer membrane receptor for ferrienterochelin and colicins
MKKVLLVILVLQLVSAVHAQKKTDANIFGHVVTNGDHIPFATISVKGTTYGVNTDETGHYQLINLPAGRHTIRAQALGYRPQEKQIEISEGQTIELSFSLEQDILGLEEVVVSADRSEMKRTEAVTMVNTLSPKLFSSAQSLTLSEGLSFSPGLRIENNCQNCGFSQVRMNGLEGPYTQILINSRPIFSGLAGVYGLELIPSNMIERVEVVRGGGSALFGSNAIAGTINIILKEPESNSYEAGFFTGLAGTGIKASGGAAPDFNVNLNTSVVSDDGKTGFTIFGFTRERELFDANDDGFSEISPMKNLTLGTRIFHRFGMRSRFSFDFFNITEERNGGNRQDYPLHERDVAEAVEHDIKTAALSYEKYVRDYDLLSVYFSGQRLRRNSYYGANRSLSDYGRSSDLTYNAGIQYKAYFGSSSLVGGVENTGGFLTDKKLGYTDYANAVIAGDSIISVPHTLNVIVADQSNSVSGFFLQYEIRSGKLKAGAGGRLDHYRIYDNALHGEVKNGFVFSPRISLMYELVRSLQARFSYSKGYRAPQIFDEDLHIETSAARRVINENDPALKQETSHSVLASLDYNRLIGTVSTGVLIEGFFTRLKDPFVNEIGMPDGEGTVIYTRRNAVDGAVVKGFNIEIKARTLKEFSSTAGFTVQSSRFDVVQEFNSVEFLRTPSVYGYLNLDYDFAENFCLAATGTHTGRMYVPYFGPFTDPENGELRRSESFFDLGMKLSYNIKINGASLQVYSGVRNLLNSYQNDFDRGPDRDPSYIYGPVSPRTIYVGLRLGNKLL